MPSLWRYTPQDRDNPSKGANRVGPPNAVRIGGIVSRCTDLQDDRNDSEELFDSGEARPNYGTLSYPTQ